ncbi:DUF2493 domain-containing protein [Streptomyces sp. ISL-94]|uniref:DUF2493 domain-containing protein n=1 Tax=Streptomyces sp. ISL-94 TaxID=2819190 RepID=UPI001BE77CEB|nr:DUF2493 domain-containing protein [Streptomyces sp. ISL-94]MBT2477613.1 DUF2493 domain-containing protein [Streptomyces sp. ISL-94]
MTEQPATRRILVTGSRNWTDIGTIRRALDEAYAFTPADHEFVLAHGGCPTGADAIAHAWADRTGVTIDIFIADWANHGKAAGPRRNARMVAEGADLCLSFIRNGSRGASHTVALARRAGIPVRTWTSP